MKKGVYVVLMLILVSAVFGLSYIDNISQLSDSILTFNGNSDVATYVTLPGNAYVLSSTMTFNGELSEWELVYNYTNLNSPQDAEYISSNQWLISDTDNNRLLLVNPISGSLDYSYSTVSGPQDAEYIDSDTLLITDTGNDKIILLENIQTVPTEKILFNRSIPDPIFVDADLVDNERILVTDQANKIVRLINVTNMEDVSNYSTNPSTTYDSEFISDEIWLVARSIGIVEVNVTDGTVINQYNDLITLRDVYDVEYVSSEKWLITHSNEVILLNITSGVIINSYSDGLVSAKDAEYINDFEWLVTDETGTRKVQLVKKYYPTNPTIDVTNDSDIEWGYSGEFDTTDVFNYQNFTDELNELLDTLPDDNTAHSIPLLFHSDTSGIINITDVNITYNQKPNVTVTYPNGGEYLAGIQSVQWVYYDDDNTDDIIVNLYYWNITEWIVLSSGVNITNYSWDTTTIQNDDTYLVLVHVNDTHNNASDQSDAVFTIDNTLPTVDITMGDTFLRKDGVTITANATDNYDVNRVNATIECPGDTIADMVLTNTSANVFTVTWQSNVTTEIGNCTVTVDVEDMAGNVNTTTKVITLKLSMEVSLDLSDTNPTTNTDVTAYGYVYYDNGTVDSRLVNVTFGGADYNTTSNAVGYYSSTVRITGAGTVYAHIYENGETFSNSSAVTIKTTSGSGGGGGGSSATCGDGVCQVNRETCATCSKDCGFCQTAVLEFPVAEDDTFGLVTEGDDDSEDGLNSGFVEQVPEEISGGEVLQPEEEVVDNLVAGSGWGIFTDFLKNPRTLLIFIIVITVIALLFLGGWSNKKKKDKFLREFGD
ncbi:MAG: hypothetical protein U9R08_04810 [Nanoarchaeota archaeon]|nr:hypothetical protein [Nanoarchaeota archaeon]